MTRKVMWPLYYCISELARFRLAQYQIGWYGYELEIPPYPYPTPVIAPIIMTEEEASRLMKRRPRYSRGAKAYKAT